MKKGGEVLVVKRETENNEVRGVGGRVRIIEKRLQSKPQMVKKDYN